MKQQIAYPIRNSLYLSITDRCTLVCEFCPKTHGDYHVQGYDLEMDHRPEVDEILQSLPELESYDEIVFCGFGEPTLRLKTLLAVATEIKKRDKKIRLNTDGLGNLVNKRNILPELGAVVDSVSISINAQNEEVYNQLCQPQLPGSYQAMLEFVRQAPAYIDDVTVTAINGLENVDINACRQMATELGVKFRQRELDRVG
ncbi:MAG: radical SAM protein [Gammaproteobacteria bacterium]|nr:TatD family nuclease-associated radical SAM protein [Gammaproteobacteria bacterium]NNJ90326.1 radical SAM protein [Gammaproteobacteria bacterium]